MCSISMLINVCVLTVCVCLLMSNWGQPLRASRLQSKHRGRLFLFFPMRSRLRRYLNIPRVRCTCSPACSAKGFFPPSLSLSLPLPARLPFCLSVQSRNTLSGRGRDSQTRLSNDDCPVHLWSSLRNFSFISLSS